MPNQYEYSKTFFDRWYRPEHTTVIVAGDVKPGEVDRRSSRSTGAPGRRAATTVDVPQEPPAKGPVYAHVPWPRRHAAVGHRRVPRPGLLRDERRMLPALDALFDLRSARPRTSTRSLVEDEQKVDQLGRASCRQRRTPYARRRLRPPQEDRGRVYVRDEILRAFARPRVAPRARAAPRRREVDNARYALAARRSTTPSRSPASSRASCASAARTRRSTTSTAPTTRSRRPTSRPPRRTYLADAGLVADDALEGSAARGDRRSPRSRRFPSRSPCRSARPPRRPRSRRRDRRRRGLRAARPALEAAAARRQAPLRRGLRARPGGQGGPRRAHGRDDRRRRLAGDDDRRDQEGALPDGGELRRAGGQGDDDLHRRRPPRQLGALRRDRAARSSSSPASARRTSGALKDAAEERARRGPPHQQRGGARQGAPADAHLPGHALRAPGARHGRRDRGDHARRREGLRAARPTRAAH